MMIEETGRKRIVATAGAILILVVLFLGVWVFVPFKTTYLIPGVPYVSAHNHVGDLGFISNDSHAAMFTLFEYWNSGAQTPRETALLPPEKGYLWLLDIARHTRAVGGYRAVIEKLSLQRLDTYINETDRTPLITFLPLSSDQTLPTSIAVVLIGVDERDETLTFQHYYFGGLYTISFDEFTALQSVFPPNSQNLFLVIIPSEHLRESRAAVAARTHVPYESDGEVVTRSRDMFKDMLLGAGAWFAEDYTGAKQYYRDLFSQGDFEEWFPPYFKVFSHAQYADALWRLGDLDEAREYALRAVSENHDLDEPFKDWPGFEFRAADRLSEPHRVLGDALRSLGEHDEARDAYEDALAINPFNKRARFGLEDLSR